jgi:hypothetical protein
MSEAGFGRPWQVVKRSLVTARNFLREWSQLTPVARLGTEDALRKLRGLNCITTEQKREIRQEFIRYEMRYHRFLSCLYFYFTVLWIIVILGASVAASILGAPVAASNVDLKNLDAVYGDNRLLLYALIYSAIVPLFLIRRFIGARWFADSYLVNRLLNLLWLLEGADARWLSLRSRRRAMKAIERVARTVERDIRLAMRTRDPITRQWVREQTWQIAAGIRQLKTSFVIPGSNIAALVSDKLVPAFVAAVKSDWGDMVDRVGVMSEPPESASRLARILTSGLEIATTLLAIGLLIVSIYVQTKHGKEFLSRLGISGEDATGLTTVVSSISAALLLYLAQTGKAKFVTEGAAKKAAEAVTGPGGSTSASPGDQAK